MKKDISLGKFLSLILRHKPETVGITLDENGWADIKDLIDGVARHGHKIDFETLDRIVRENNKQRFSFNEDKTKIRANQGHSINVNVELSEKLPPEFLYHGTATRFVESIRENGILKRGRLYVHLSGDTVTAKNVGLRHGKPVVLTVNAQKMFQDGYKFFISENNVWLTDDVPVKYIDFDEIIL